MPATKKAAEPEDGSKTYTVTLSLSATADEDTTVKYDIAAITATDGMDFISQSETLTIVSGAKTADIEFSVLGDALDENDETFLISLSSPTNATLSSNFNATTVTVTDSDDDSTVGFETEGATVTEDAGIYTAKVKLSTATEKDVSIPFTVSGLATRNLDYSLLTTSPITVPARSDEVEIQIELLTDSVPEGGETVVIALGTPDNAEQGDNIQHIIQITGETVLNDTGVTSWYSGASDFTNTSENSEYPGQDAEFGLDATDAASYDGHAGFSFTKLDAAGNALPSDDESFRCVRDNRTNLVWEVKNTVQTITTITDSDALKEVLRAFDDENPYPWDDAHANWQAANYKYYWYNPDTNSNGGDEGTKSNSFVSTTYPMSADCAFAQKSAVNYINTSNRCNTQIYEDTMNKLSVCGFKDWKLPTITQLQSIQNYRATDPETEEVNYFPNSAEGAYISSTPSADGSGAAWCLDTIKGQVKLCKKQVTNYVRMVRGVSE